jgi:hypothetical protein
MHTFVLLTIFSGDGRCVVVQHLTEPWTSQHRLRLSTSGLELVLLASPTYVCRYSTDGLGRRQLPSGPPACVRACMRVCVHACVCEARWQYAFAVLRPGILVERCPSCPRAASATHPSPRLEEIGSSRLLESRRDIARVRAIVASARTTACHHDTTTTAAAAAAAARSPPLQQRARSCVRVYACVGAPQWTPPAPTVSIRRAGSTCVLPKGLCRVSNADGWSSRRSATTRRDAFVVARPCSRLCLLGSDFMFGGDSNSQVRTHPTHGACVWRVGTQCSGLDRGAVSLHMSGSLTLSGMFVVVVDVLLMCVRAMLDALFV